jgi:hypothetical protein
MWGQSGRQKRPRQRKRRRPTAHTPAPAPSPPHHERGDALGPDDAQLLRGRVVHGGAAAHEVGAGLGGGGKGGRRNGWGRAGSRTQLRLGRGRERAWGGIRARAQGFCQGRAAEVADT